MRAKLALPVLAMVLFAGCGGFFGGPQVVEDECVEEFRGLISCDVIVENPEEEPMTVEVTVEIEGSGDAIHESDSETVGLGPGERETVSIAFAGIGGDLYYDVDVREVED